VYDPDPRVRLEAAVALWRIDRSAGKVVPTLIKALRAEDELLRWIAADCLGDIGPEAADAVPTLLAALRENFKLGMIRLGVALALQRIDPVAAARAGIG
jgi:HEAT repeat protein